MYATTLEADVEATMRDGVVLRADVYRPDVDGKFPVILERTPYNKGADRFHEKGAKLAERGFLYVIQDVRGRYGSDGEFMPGFFSGDFPNFDRNHNTGGNDYADATLVAARQTVFHDAERPSHVILPIIPR